VVHAFSEFRDLSDPNPAELAQLSAWLVSPVRERLRTPVVGIIPSDVLHYVPFAALRDGDTYLGETHTLFHLPSASTLPYIAAKRKAQPGELVALAQSQAAGLPSLRFADGEAQEVAALYGARAVTGDAATESAFRSAAGGAGILHLAAHGELNSTAPLFSRIFLAPEGESDGSLTVQEVYSLDLRRADLVVLSACETVLGEQSRGDDIVGLNRAFIYAGAPTVVASLWSVNDLATSVLMTAFYRGLQGGLSKAEALQAAQAETRAVFPHPFYWAAFVLTGDDGPSAVR
jgi:CHAT domain-containing protein